MTTSDIYAKDKTAQPISQPVLIKFSLIQNHARAWMSLMLALTDCIALLLTFLLAINLRQGGLDFFDRFFYVDYLWVPIVLMMIIYASFGLYPGIGISAVEEVRRLSLSTSLVFLIVITLTFLLKTAEIYSRVIFILAWLIALFLLPLARKLIRSLCVKLKVWGEPAAIVGFPDRRVVEVAEFFIKYPQKGIDPKVIYVDSAVHQSAPLSYSILPGTDSDDSKSNPAIKTVLVVVPNWNWVSENIDKFRYRYEHVILIRPEGVSFSLSDSLSLDFNGVMGLQIHHNLLNPWAMLLKRLIDLFFSLFFLIALAPLVAVLSILIHLDSPGGIYYRQDRLGLGGKIFRVIKFRTMYANADQVFKDKLKKDPNLQAEWKKYQKLKSDPRITHVGALLRKFSLDELPQLWNILYGQMSLVGPRPIMLSQREMYGFAFHDYSRIRPGVTGLWQVSGRNHTTFARRAELDMEYIQRWSIWLDLYIIFQTIKEVLSKDGAY